MAYATDINSIFWISYNFSSMGKTKEMQVFFFFRTKSSLRVHSILKLVLGIMLLHISIIVSAIRLLWYYSSQIAFVWDASVIKLQGQYSHNIRINFQFTIITLNHANEIIQQTLLLSNTRRHVNQVKQQSQRKVLITILLHQKYFFVFITCINKSIYISMKL